MMFIPYESSVSSSIGSVAARWKTWNLKIFKHEKEITNFFVPVDGKA